MKQVTIQTGKATIVVVDVPKEINLTPHKNHEHYLLYLGILCEKYRISRGFRFREILDLGDENLYIYDNIKLAGHPSQLTEEDWKGIVDPNRFHGDLYRSYDEIDIRPFSFATESGLSLLKANGVVMENCLGSSGDHLSAIAWQEWNQEQSKAWLNPQIFVKV